MMSERYKSYYKFFVGLVLILVSTNLYAACGGSTRTWAGNGSNAWNSNANWSPADYPNTSAEDVVIINTATNARMTTTSTVGCVDVQSGVLEGTQNRRLTVVGDYFSAPNANTLSFTSNNFKIDMAGTSPQTFEAVDDIRDLFLSNDTSVTLKNNFRVRSDLIINSTGTTYVEGDLWLHNTSLNHVIPAGHTLVIKSGASLYTRSDLTIEGVVKIEAGGELRLYRTKSLTVNPGGILQLAGASGNPARVVSEAANRSFMFNMNGTLTANNFLIQRTDSAGTNITGTVTQMDNGEFRGIAGSGAAITLSATAVMPGTLDTIGMFNDDDRGTVTSVDASAYSAGLITFTNFSGDVTSAQENDPNNQIAWSVPAATELAILNDSETGEPGQFFDPGDEFTFAEFAFSLSQVDTATDITEVQVTMTGSASISDLEYVRAYLDTNSNCNFNAANDTLIGDLSFSGSPAKATISLSPGDLNTNSPTDQACLIIRAKASANPVDQKTVKFGIISSTDVVNSTGYTLSATSGTPIESNMSTIRNPNYSTWSGQTSTAWNDGSNWDGGLPSSARDCHIGVATNLAQVNTTPVECANANLLSNGIIDWNSTSNSFNVYGTLEVQPSFIFNNSTSGNIVMNGSMNQNLTLATAFPGNLIINNSGIANSNIVTLGASSTVNGNLTCTDGVLYIPNGTTLTVLGSITVQTGCEVSIGAGGTLSLADTQTLTINTGGKLKVVGTSGTYATVGSNSGAASYNVIVNGTIEARYYTFDHLGTNGVSIEAGATIDATNFLQDGSYIYPVNSGSTQLALKTQIPGNTLSNMTFDDNGSGAAGTTNIDTTGAAAGTLTISSYSGNLGGPTLDNDPTYLIAWSGQTNTIDLSTEATGPGTVTVGGTYNMGRFGFTQSLAGASYNDTDVTKIALSLTGTAPATDITAVRLYSDSNCDGASGTLLGTTTFSGLPAKASFSITPSSFTILADVATPPKNCVYVEYDISSNATNGNTVGVKIASASDVTNSETYNFSASAAPPMELGTASTIYAPSTTIWTGTTSTDWTDASNWSAGVPSTTKTCQIPSAGNNPIISTGTANCQNVDITNGTLTLSGGAILEVYGNFTNTGTFSQTGTLSIADGGTNTSHNLTSTSTLANLDINKTGGGIIEVTDSELIINSVTITGTNYRLNIASSRKLVLPNGVNITGGEFRVSTGGILEIGNAQTLQVSGGVISALGINDTFPQNVATKAIIRPQGGTGSWTFSAISGTVNLKGFQLDYLDANGLNISGSTILQALDGGQLTNLPTSYASVKAIQLNSTGSLPLTASNIAWSWGAFNSFNPANGGTPAPTDPYTLVSSTGCSGQTIDFTGWSGDWFESQVTFDVTTRVSASGCTVNMASAASAVALRSLEAIPYNAAIDIRWETNSESNHLGFNIYRADESGDEYQQINSTIIRNFNNAGQARGTYRFIDSDVDNDNTYFYYIEDIEIAGKRTLHGPVHATPDATLGAPPADGADDNSGTNPNDGDDGNGANPFPIQNPSYRDLGNGVVIHNQTSSNIRLVITPDAPVFTASAWNGTYEDVSVTGYSKESTAGLPEIPERILLIEVYDYATTASLINSTVSGESTLAGHNISPAPTWTMDGNGDLQASYSPNATHYATSADTPSQYFDVDTTLQKSGSKTYLRIKVNPLKYNPVSQDVTRATSIELDIGLDGNDWSITPPSAGDIINPFIVANTLKVDYSQAGMYQLDYNDLNNSSVEGPFDGVDINDLRLYYNGSEIPLEINSPSGFFSTGDYIRFYAPFSASLEDLKNSVVLSTVEISEDSNTAKRMASLNGDPSGEQAASDSLSIFTKTYESNTLYVDGETLEDTEDHFFGSRLFNIGGFDTYSLTVNTPEIDNTSDTNVIIKLHVKGLNYNGVVTLHHMSVEMSGSEEMDHTFADERQILTFEIPADRFIAGNNTIDFKLLGTYAAAGTFEQVYIDKTEIAYVGNGDGSLGKSVITLEESSAVHTITNFGSLNLNIYDTTTPLDASIISNASITTPDAGASYTASFFVNDNENDESLKNIQIIETGSFLSPNGLSLNPGNEQSLKNTDNRADLIIIGHKNLLPAVDELITQRTSQGLEVMLVTPRQIYGEFSNGQVSTSAIRDFMNFAIDSWTNKPEYLLVLGDGTNDPLDHNIDSESAADRVVLDEETIPTPHMTGRFMEFGTDNYFVTQEGSTLPRISVGRLPSNDPEDIRNYVTKLIAYENGTSQPDELKTISFVSDTDLGYYEKFSQRSTELASTASSFVSTQIDRTALGSDAATKTEVINSFTNSPLIVSMMGHGASNTFGTNILQTTDASALTNTKLPIVMTWNCETALYFYSARYEESLSEKLIFNPTGGAVVFMGSTTQTTPSAQNTLAQNFFSTLEGDIQTYYKGQRIGDLIIRAKAATGTGAYEQDIVKSYTIIGDPSLQIPSSMFPDAPPVVEETPSSGGGCSVNAAHTGGLPWYTGILEYFICFVLLAFMRYNKWQEILNGRRNE
ncbi:MAG: hypothetical protein BM556_05305 [Bacteriovorax sp. MedPE-SWde]|mgnify:CR=1 FL=1|nr:MAG: hypothetical protein BM556_05305 [Bacteriovorax sp. MedPE-SWde]